MNFIERLKNKPHHTRKRIAFLGSAFITLFIFFVWAVSFPAKLKMENSPNASNLASPLSGFSEGMRNAISSLRDSVSLIFPKDKEEPFQNYNQ